MELLNPLSRYHAHQLLAWNEDEWEPTEGQISFILSKAPLDSVSKEVFVNGVLVDDDIDYILSGVTLTWLNTNFVLSTDDKLTVRYR